MSNTSSRAKRGDPERDGLPRPAMAGLAMTVVLLLDLILQTYFRGLGVGMFNQGLSFGLLPGTGKGIAIVVYLVFIIFSGLMNQAPTKPARINLAIWLLAVGGMGNLVPRLIWSGVWDYIHVPILPFWFNLSDVLIVIGVISYILGVDGNCCFVRGQRDTGNK